VKIWTEKLKIEVPKPQT